MARPIWKGYISFGLVNIPVVLYSAEKKFDIQLKLIDSRDNSRIRYLRVNEQTGQEVPWSAVKKGYEYDEDNFVLIGDEDIKEMVGENTKTINIEHFISRSSLECIDFEKPYYLVPDKKGNKGYVILRETLKNTNKVGIATVTIHTRQYLAAVISYENALVLDLLHYHQDLRKPSEFDIPAEQVKDYKISSKEMEIAKELVELMTTKWEPDAYHNDFREKLEKWVEDKINHRPQPKKRKTSVATSNVTNFVDLLKKSLKDKRNQSQGKVAHKRKTSHAK